jgi:hypothetical protein
VAKNEKAKFTKTKFPNLSLGVLVATHNTLKITHNMSQETSITTPSSDTSDSGSDADDFPEIAELRVTPTEAFYNQNNQSMKCLVVLCEGLKDVNGDYLLDIRSFPFSSLKRGDIKPTADMFRDEVVRRRLPYDATEILHCNILLVSIRGETMALVKVVVQNRGGRQTATIMKPLQHHVFRSCSSSCCIVHTNGRSTFRPHSKSAFDSNS